jgi:alpha-amylase
MSNVCLYFQVHQPYRLRRYSVFDTDSHYFDDHRNAELLRRIAHKCYIPANQILKEAVQRHQGKFKLAFSMTGTVLEQLESAAPEALDSFKALVDTGHVELLLETYHHSLSFFY